MRQRRLSIPAEDRKMMKNAIYFLCFAAAMAWLLFFSTAQTVVPITWLWILLMICWFSVVYYHTFRSIKKAKLLCEAPNELVRTFITVRRPGYRPIFENLYDRKSLLEYWDKRPYQYITEAARKYASRPENDIAYRLGQHPLVQEALEREFHAAHLQETRVNQEKIIDDGQGGVITMKYFKGEGYGWSFKVKWFGGIAKPHRRIPIQNCAWCRGKFYGEDYDEALAQAKMALDVLKPKVS